MSPKNYFFEKMGTHTNGGNTKTSKKQETKNKGPKFLYVKTRAHRPKSEKYTSMKHKNK